MELGGRCLHRQESRVRKVDGGGAEEKGAGVLSHPIASFYIDFVQRLIEQRLGS